MFEKEGSWCCLIFNFRFSGFGICNLTGLLRGTFFAFGLLYNLTAFFAFGLLYSIYVVQMKVLSLDFFVFEFVGFSNEGFFAFG